MEDAWQLPAAMRSEAKISQILPPFFVMHFKTRVCAVECCVCMVGWGVIGLQDTSCQLDWQTTCCWEPSGLRSCKVNQQLYLLVKNNYSVYCLHEICNIKIFEQLQGHRILKHLVLYVCPSTGPKPVSYWRAALSESDGDHSSNMGHPSIAWCRTSTNVENHLLCLRSQRDSVMANFVGVFMGVSASSVVSTKM